MSHRDLHDSQEQLSPGEVFLEEASRLSDDPKTRLSPRVLSLLQQQDVFIDIHAHCFTYRNVPENFLKLRLVKVPHKFLRSRFVKWLASMFRAPVQGNFAFLSVMAYSQSRLISLKLANAYQRYLMNTRQEKPILMVMLSMNMEVGISQDIPEPFPEQLKQLEETCLYFEQRPSGTVHLIPFLAIDPNSRYAYRNFLLKIVRQKTDYPYFGIKIYPSLGYLPSHPVLMDVFQVCEQKNIPVTTHCGSGSTSADAKSVRVKGLEKNTEGQWTPLGASNEGQVVSLSGNDEFERYFNSPARWEPVLEAYPELRLNLAHFGSSPQWESYLKTPDNPSNHVTQTLRLIEMYPNVYADISYSFFSLPVLEKLVELMQEKDVFRDRFLFGSDFYLILREDDMGDIMNRFHQTFYQNPILYDKLTKENPKRFLLG
jgi:predicted TIM-barrel fold metal-dependent hydrolase